MQRVSKVSAAVWVLVAAQLPLALGALAGGAALMLDPRGEIISLPVEMLAGTPFSTYLVPGALLFTFLGAYPALAAYGLARRPGWALPERINLFHGTHWVWAASLAAGGIPILWIAVQMLMLGYISVLQPFYVAWGMAIIGLTLLPQVQRHYRLEQ